MPESAAFLLAIPGIVSPIALPIAAWALSVRLTKWWRVVLVVLALLVSLPVGIALMLVANDPAFFGRDHAALGVGLAVLPVLWVWLGSFAVVVATTFWIAIEACYSRWKSAERRAASR